MSVSQQVDFLDNANLAKVSFLGRIASVQLQASAYWPSIQCSLNQYKILMKNDIGRNDIK